MNFMRTSYKIHGENELFIMNFMRTSYKIHVSETGTLRRKESWSKTNGVNLVTVKTFFIRGASLISSILQLLYL
jgi:hypothetical protein